MFSKSKNILKSLNSSVSALPSNVLLFSGFIWFGPADFPIGTKVSKSTPHLWAVIGFSLFWHMTGERKANINSVYSIVLNFEIDFFVIFFIKYDFIWVIY